MPATSIREFSDTAVDPKVRGFLHTSDSPNGDGLILSHGAGSNATAPLLVALAETFSANGFTVLRCDLPYRQSSMLCAENPDLVSGLLLLSYPLHPPRKPERQRTQHLPDLRTPTLFVQGTRDPFATISELERTLKMIPSKTKLLTIEGAGHDLGFKGKTKREELLGRIFSEFTQLLDLSS